MTQHFLDYLQTQMDSLHRRQQSYLDQFISQKFFLAFNFDNIKNFITEYFINLCQNGIINSDKIQEFKKDFEECGVFFNREPFEERACVYFDSTTVVAAFNAEKVFIRNADAFLCTDVGEAFVENANSVSVYGNSSIEVLSSDFVHASDNSSVYCNDVKTVLGTKDADINCRGVTKVSARDNCHVTAYGDCSVFLSDFASGVLDNQVSASCMDNSYCELDGNASAFLYGGRVVLSSGSNSTCYNLQGNFSVEAEKQNTLIMERTGMDSVLYIQDHFNNGPLFFIKAKYLGDWLDGNFEVSCTVNNNIIGEKNFGRRDFLSLLNKRTSNITLFAGLFDEQIIAFNKALNSIDPNHIFLLYKQGGYREGFYICAQIIGQETPKVKISYSDWKKVRNGFCTKKDLVDKYLKSEIEKLICQNLSQDVSRGLKL